MSEKQSADQITENTSGKETENVNLTEQEVTKSVCLLDSWFIRASWLYKREFLFRCLEHISKDGLEQLVLLLGPPTKDYYYSLSGYTNYAEDIIPQDNNRQLDKKALDRARDSDFQWILSLPRQQIANILIGLTELSGNALRMHLYARARKLLTRINSHQTHGGEIMKTVKENDGLPKGVNKNSKEFATFKAQLDKYNDFIEKLKKKIIKVNAPEKTGTTKKHDGHDHDTLDYIQMLPSWICRQVLSYLDLETLKKCERVNSYWRKSVKAFREEIETRVKLDSLIVALKPTEETIKLFKIKREKKKTLARARAEEEDALKAIQANLMKIQSESLELTDDQKVSSSLIETSESTILETTNVFPKSKDRFAFRKQHLLIWTLDEYANNRILALGKRWLAFSRGGTIVLCTVISFANMPGSIKAHDGRITAMAFHPTDGQLVTAGTDSIVRRWEVWSRQQMHKVSFPQVKHIVTNSNFYVVAGPAIIKVFCWKLNACQCTIDIEDSNTINILILSQDDTLYVSYLQDSIVRRISARNGALIWELPRTNRSRITSLHLWGCYITTSNEEGHVNLWKLNETEQLLIATRHFLRKINQAVLHEGCILAAADNGELYFWDLRADEIVQTSTINEDSMPILTIHLLNYYDHCKVILSSEMGIKVLQFMYHRKHMKKVGFVSPYTCRSLPHAITETSVKVITLREKKKEAKLKEEQMKRQSCHPNLRKDLEKILTIKETSANFLLREDIGGLRYFPAIYGDHVKSKFTHPQVKQDAEEDQPQELQLTFKNFLPMLNPYKHRF